MGLERIRIVLVRPEEAGNVGAAPRTSRPEEAWKWAHGALPVLEGADLVSDLREAIGTSVRAWALTRRRGGQRRGGIPVEEAARETRVLLAEGMEVAWVFGPESTGLTNEEVDLCSRPVHISTAPRQPSLNLAQAVAVCAHEIFRAGVETSPPVRRESTREERWRLAARLEEVLLDIGYLEPHSARARLTPFLEMLERTRITPEEIRILLGLIRQIQGKIRASARTGDPGGDHRASS
jgi:tRNA/rRNA methyltransferase